MLDEAKPQAGPDATSASGPAGQDSRRQDSRRSGQGLEAASAVMGVTGEIVVTRNILGIGITSRVARSSFMGVMLKAPPPGARRGYAIALAATAGGEDVLLAGDLDETDIVAQWRAIAAELGLPALICHADGEIETLHGQLGAVTLGHSGESRRSKPIAKNRRPRFLMRRKAGRVGSFLLPFTGESARTK